MKDALKPISGHCVDQFSCWAVTLVDILDTLWMMGMREEFHETVIVLATIDFGKNGLIAAYDFSGHEVLLRKAIEVDDLLYAGFNTENVIPVDFINSDSAKDGSGLRVESQVVSASPGTITLNSVG